MWLTRAVLVIQVVGHQTPEAFGRLESLSLLLVIPWAMIGIEKTLLSYLNISDTKTLSLHAVFLFLCQVPSSLLVNFLPTLEGWPTFFPSTL